MRMMLQPTGLPSQGLLSHFSLYSSFLLLHTYWDGETNYIFDGGKVSVAVHCSFKGRIFRVSHPRVHIEVNILLSLIKCGLRFLHHNHTGIKAAFTNVRSMNLHSTLRLVKCFAVTFNS